MVEGYVSNATNELVTVMIGKLRLIIGEEEILAEPGDEVFIPRGVSNAHERNIPTARIAKCLRNPVHITALLP